jgi:DNA-binding response OmpR family regulator
LHHGSIRVESAENVGTTFFVEIPIDRESYTIDELDIKEPVINKKDLEVLSLDDMEAGANDAPEKKNILLVEDNEELLALMTRILSLKFQVVTAKNGVEALGVVNRNKPEINIIISDVMMPEMDGLELCSTLKNNMETSHIPIILLTAKNSEEDRIDCYNAGADGYVSKPFELNVLEARINNFLARRQGKQNEFKTNIEINISQLEHNTLDEQFLKKAVSEVEQNINETGFDIDVLAHNLNMSRATFYRKIKSLTDLTPNDFILNIRLKYACIMLKDSAASVTDVAYAVGFSDTRYFATCFKKVFKQTPKAFQKSNEPNGGNALKPE